MLWSSLVSDLFVRRSEFKCSIENMLLKLWAKADGYSSDRPEAGICNL